VRWDNHLIVVKPWILLVLEADTGGALAGTDLPLLAVTGRLLSGLDDGVVARKTADNACSSLGEACSSVKLDEVRELFRLSVFSLINAIWTDEKNRLKGNPVVSGETVPADLRKG
jgi:hypothetical protein